MAKMSASERAELEARLAADNDDDEDQEDEVRAGAVVLHGRAAERYLAGVEERKKNKDKPKDPKDGPDPGPDPDPDPAPAPVNRYFR